MKKQVTYEISEKPAFDNELDLKQTMQFLVKVEETVKLYNKHQKALKDYMVKNNLVDLQAGEYNAHISEGTPRCSISNALVEEYCKANNLNINNFKVVGNPPKSMEIYRK